MVNILIVDDEQINLDIIENLLNTKLDVNVFVALGVKEALKVLGKINIDIIITDLMMPDIDGLEFIRILKDDSRYENIPTIILTASCDKENELKSYQEGAFDYLSKPIIEDKLINKIKVLAFNILNTRGKTLLSNNTFLIEQASNINNDLIETKKENTLFRDDMVAIFTHELKTPLNAIIAFSDYIQRNIKKPLTPKKIDKFEELASKIHSNGTVQLHMIEAILEASRIKLGKIKVNKIRINPYNMLSKIIEEYKIAYSKEVALDIDENLIIFIDPKLYKMIFENLFSNALKYSKSKILVTLKKEKDSFILSVEDDGDGIEPKDIHNIFNLFEQADKEAYKREKTGTGVGLYTVKHLATLCGKDIEVSSSNTLGGAKFSIIDAAFSGGEGNIV